VVFDLGCDIRTVEFVRNAGLQLTQRCHICSASCG
jgi:hypothetical protein